MARSKKVEEKPKEGATLTIDVDSFVRTRDSVVTGLATLQDAIHTLSTAYIKHTNAVLGEHGAGADVESALSRLGDNPLLGGLGNLSNNRAASPVPSVTAVESGDKKERKKRQHDPNAPKRPLTPYFLYMRTARPIIAQDLGPDAKPGAVSSEGTRRWGTMELEAKQLWTNAYKDNLRLYNARMHSYRTGNLAAKEMSDQDALTYADEHNIGVGASADAQLVGEASSAGAAGLLDDEDEDAEGEPEKEPTPPPPKTPKAKASRKSRASDKAAKNTPAAPEAIVPSSASIVPPTAPATKEKEKEKSPEKKRKRASKKGADEPVATVEKEDAAPPAETPRSAPKPRKKKAKTDA